MAYSSPMTAVTGATFTAAQFNVYVRDNLNAIWVGTTAGDIDYYSAATVKTRLAKPALTSYLYNSTSGVPAWGSLVGAINISSIAPLAPSGTYSSTSYTDITGATANIVTTKTCTIIMMASGTIAITSGTPADSYTQPVIDGTAPASDNGASFQTLSSTLNPVSNFTVIHRKSGVAAGTITCKLQAKVIPTGGALINYPPCVLFIMAVEE